MPITASNPFKGRQHPGELIISCVRLYLRYPLLYEHVTKLMEERGGRGRRQLHLALGPGVCARLPKSDLADVLIDMDNRTDSVLHNAVVAWNMVRSGISLANYEPTAVRLMMKHRAMSRLFFGSSEEAHQSVRAIPFRLGSNPKPQ